MRVAPFRGCLGVRRTIGGWLGPMATPAHGMARGGNCGGPFGASWPGHRPSGNPSWLGGRPVRVGLPLGVGHTLQAWQQQQPS